MKTLFPILLASSFAFNAMADDFDDLSNDQMVDAIIKRGDTRMLGAGFRSNDAEKWVDRCMKDERLKRYAYREINSIDDVDLRFKLMAAQLRDHDYWNAGRKNLMSQSWMYYTSTAIDCIAKDLPVLTTDSVVRHRLNYTLHLPEGRDAVAAALEKFVALPRDERSESNSKVQAIIVDIQDAISKYADLKVDGIPPLPREDAPTPRVDPPTPEKSAPATVTFVEHQKQKEHTNPLLIGSIVVILGLICWIAAEVSRKRRNS